MLTLLLVASLSAEPAKHETFNPLYKSLLDPGLAVGADAKAKFPAPTMPDGLDAAAQTGVIKKLIGDDYTYDNFTRNAVPAPHILKLRDVNPSDPKAPARGVDLWFVAYGDLKALEDDKFLDRVANSGGGTGKAKSLTEADLTKRKITVGDTKREQFGHLEFDFLEKVHLKVTGRVVWTRTDDSVVVAAEVDPRFNGDPEFPNQWQSIVKEGGASKLGPAQPWSGAGFYLKITKLAAPAGALFVEQHVIFAEPTGWFDGANLLRSKLPLVMQNNVRTMRTELRKVK
jgi:hypothetical protein